MDNDILDLAELAAKSYDPTIDADLAELNEIEISDDLISSRVMYNDQDYTPEEQFKHEIIEENRLALKLIADQRMKDSLILLKRCEARIVQEIKVRGQTPFYMKLLSITLTNIAFYCRKKGIYQIALKYLARVLQIEKNALDQKVTLASTYLNISSILSNLNKHKESYKYCSIANRMYLDIKEASIQGGKSDASEKTGLVSSYLNMATNMENLGNFKAALSHANEGFHFALVELGIKHPLAQNIRTYLEKLTRRIESTAKKQSMNGRENAFGSHRYRQDDDHSRSVTVDQRNKRGSGSEESAYDESYAGLPGLSVKRAKTIDKPRRYDNDILLVDIKPARPKSNVKSELSTLIEDLKVPQSIKEKYAPQAPKSGMGSMTSQKPKSMLRSNRPLPPKPFNPLFVPNYGAESHYSMAYPVDPSFGEMRHQPQTIPGYYRAQTPIQVNPMHPSGMMQLPPRLPPTHQHQPPISHMPLPAGVYGYQPNQTGSFGQSSHATTLPPHFTSGYMNQTFESQPSYGYSQPQINFEGSHHTTQSQPHGNQIGLPRLPRLPEIGEVSDHRDPSRTATQAYSVSVMPKGQMTVMLENRHPLKSGPNLASTTGATSRADPNLSSLEINASDFITNDSLKSKSDQEDGSKIQPQPKAPLNFNRLDTIHIDLRPKGHKKTETPRSTNMPLPKEVIPSPAPARQPHQASNKPISGPREGSNSTQEVKSIDTDRLSENHRDQDNFSKKAVTFDENEKRSISQESELGLQDTITSRWQVNVEFAERKTSNKDDGQKVAQKPPPKNPTPPQKDINLPKTIKTPKEQPIQLPPPQNKASPQSLTKSQIYSQHTFRGPDHDGSLVNKTEVESVDLNEPLHPESKADRLNDKYRPKMDKIKEEPSLTDSKFLSMVDSHIGASTFTKGAQQGQPSNKSKFQITDVDMPDDGNYTPDKSSGARTNFNASNASIEDSKPSKPPMVTRSQLIPRPTHR